MSDHNPDNVSRHQGTYTPDQMWGWKFDEPLENLQAPTLENIEYYGTGWKAVDYLIERCRRAESMRDSAKDLLRIANNEITRLTDLVNRESWAPLDMVAGGPGSPWYDNEPYTFPDGSSPQEYLPELKEFWPDVVVMAPESEQEVLPSIEPEKDRLTIFI